MQEKRNWSLDAVSAWNTNTSLHSVKRTDERSRAADEGRQDTRPQLARSLIDAWYVERLNHGQGTINAPRFG